VGVIYVHGVRIWCIELHQVMSIDTNIAIIVECDMGKIETISCTVARRICSDHPANEMFSIKFYATTGLLVRIKLIISDNNRSGILCRSCSTS
jgi:hypothetical protein